MGQGTKAKNNKADSPKKLRPTRFSGPNNIKADKVIFGLIPRIFLYQTCWP